MFTYQVTVFVKLKVEQILYHLSPCAKQAPQLREIWLASNNSAGEGPSDIGVASRKAQLHTIRVLHVERESSAHLTLRRTTDTPCFQLVQRKYHATNPNRACCYHFDECGGTKVFGEVAKPKSVGKGRLRHPFLQEALQAFLTHL